MFGFGILLFLIGLLATFSPIKLPRRRLVGELICVAGCILVQVGYVPTPASAAEAPGSSSSHTPSSEMAFIAAVEAGRAAYRNGANDMLKGASRPSRAKSICGAMASKTVSNWIGQVVTLSSDNDGKGVLGISIANDVTLKTRDNAFADASTNTLIEPDSALFRSASSLSMGQWVKFSGSFFNGQDCVLETSMSISASMTTPVFTFRFTDVAPLGN